MAESAPTPATDTATVAPAPVLLTVDQLAADPGVPFTEAALRWKLHHRVDNGLAASGAVVRIGGRIYFDKARFDAWLVSGRETVETARSERRRASAARAAATAKRRATLAEKRKQREADKRSAKP